MYVVFLTGCFIVVVQLQDECENDHCHAQALREDPCLDQLLRLTQVRIATKDMPNGPKVGYPGAEGNGILVPVRPTSQRLRD